MKFGSLLVWHRVVVGTDSDPVLVRYILFAHPSTFGIMLHKMCRSETIQDQHDHPWSFFSIILRRGYGEETKFGYSFNTAGSILRRPASWRHRVIITGKPCWTLVFRGRRVRRWGYWHKDSWCWWRHYNWDAAICEDVIVHTETETNGN